MIPATYSTWTLRQGLAELLLAACASAQNAENAPGARSVALTIPVSPGAGPALEPKAIEILKAASSRLPAAQSMTFTAAVTLREPHAPTSAAGLLNAIRRHSGAPGRAAGDHARRRPTLRVLP
jgi:hypothetical protein